MLAIMIAFSSAPARAHDNHRPDLNEWYAGLVNHAGNRCCDGTEAKHVADVDWQSACSFEVKDGQTARKCRYQVFIANRWWDVPDAAVIDSPNLDGRPLVWPTYYWIDGNPEHGLSSVSIQCFLPGAGG
jgi:hypothetical protein